MAQKSSAPRVQQAEVVREYGPFPGTDRVNGVTYDGAAVWFSAGNRIQAFDPETGETTRSLPLEGDAGTAFDGRHLYQLAGAKIHRIDPGTGQVTATIPAPGDGSAGLTWAEGSLWVAQHRDGKIHRIDPATGRILKTLDTARFVTGVTWLGGELWHGTWDGPESDLRRIDPDSGEELERLTLPPGTGVSGLESDGKDRLFCGGGKSGKVRVVRRPKPAA